MEVSMGGSKCFDDDGRLKRTGMFRRLKHPDSYKFFRFRYKLKYYKFTENVSVLYLGTVWTASAHIITAVIGSGVLSLAWATAQLGWIAGPTVLFLFSFVTYYTSCLLAACYRSGDSVTGKRNYTYMEAVQANLGNFLLYFYCDF